MISAAAMIFDLDGVIADTMRHQLQAWRLLAEEEGLPFGDQDHDSLRGLSRRQSVIHLLRGRVMPESEIERLMARKQDHYLAMAATITPRDLLPGVEDLLHEIKASGYKLGLASASRNAEIVLKNLGVYSLFDAVGDSSTVAHNKPAPDLFIWVAGRLNVSCHQAIVFEDAAVGIQGARAAGMYTVGLGSPARLIHAHLVLPDLKDVRLDSVLSALSEA